MSLMPASSAWHAKMFRAIYSRIFRSNRRAQRPPMNDRLVRDVCISDQDMELLQHKWPSESYTHPRL